MYNGMEIVLVTTIFWMRKMRLMRVMMMLILSLQWSWKRAGKEKKKSWEVKAVAKSTMLVVLVSKVHRKGTQIALV